MLSLIAAQDSLGSGVHHGYERRFDPSYHFVRLDSSLDGLSWQRFGFVAYCLTVLVDRHEGVTSMAQAILAFEVAELAWIRASL